jgi:hypothetical protein
MKNAVLWDIGQGCTALYFKDEEYYTIAVFWDVMPYILVYTY